MREKALMSLLRSTGSIELEVKTSFGSIDLTAEKEAGKNKTTLIVMRNYVNKDVLTHHEDMTYEQAQDASLVQALNLLANYKLPYVEVVYGRPFL